MVDNSVHKICQAYPGASRVSEFQTMHRLATTG
jgi:hypothetical protein